VYEYQDPAALKDGSRYVAPRVWSSSTLRMDETSVSTEVTAVTEWPRFEPSVRWTGFDHPYLLAGYAAPEADRVEKHTSAGDGRDRPKGLMRTESGVSDRRVQVGGRRGGQTVVATSGRRTTMTATRRCCRRLTTGFNKVVDLGWFAFIGRPLLWLLQKFREFAGNWGVSIILLTVVVKLLTLYWTTRSMRSMKAMAALAPQMKALQTQVRRRQAAPAGRDDGVYKEHGVNR